MGASLERCLDEWGSSTGRGGHDGHQRVLIPQHFIERPVRRSDLVADDLVGFVKYGAILIHDAHVRDGVEVPDGIDVRGNVSGTFMCN